MPDEPSAIYFDANIFIYAMERDDDQGLLARRWLKQAERREIQAVTSELTLGEVLPYPLASGDGELAHAYRDLLTDRPVLRVRAVELRIILLSVELRAMHKAELPDSLHVATALDAGCRAFLTEDARLKVPPGLTKLSLADARYPL